MDYSKATYLSPNKNIKVLQSGTHQQDVAGSYNQGVLNTVQLASNIDVNNQFVYAFGTGQRDNNSIPYDTLPSGYEVITTSGSAFTDAYFFVDTNNNLQLRYRNISAISAGIVTPAKIQVAWYLCEVSTNS